MSSLEFELVIKKKEKEPVKEAFPIFTPRKVIKERGAEIGGR